MVDDIQIGDKLHLEVQVTNLSGKDGDIGVMYINSHGVRASDWVARNSPAIIKHIPKPPPPIVAGDKVKFISPQHPYNKYEGEVYGVNGPWAWVLFPVSANPITVNLNTITRIKA